MSGPLDPPVADVILRHADAQTSYPSHMGGDRPQGGGGVDHVADRASPQRSDTPPPPPSAAVPLPDESRGG